MSKKPFLEIIPKDADIYVDLFCGGGGTSTGAAQAIEELKRKMFLIAINHWHIAIDTHTENHPKALHLCQSIDTINPEDIVPGKRVKMLLASPECTHHSRARGGKPRSDQKRADAWLLLRWIEKLYIENLIIENVEEFVDWGPLTAQGKPDKRYKGKYFRQFIEALEINYTVKYAILNAADYGDATTRRRFILIAKRGKGKKLNFPAPTHASRQILSKQQNHLFNGSHEQLKPWKPAREIIDWSLKGKSVFGRKKPLSENTMRRIFAGLFKYSLKSFVMGTGGPTGQQQPRSTDDPLRTVLTDGRQNLFETFIINLKGSHRGDRSTEDPTFTQCASPNQQMLIEPFLVKFYGGHDSASIFEPLPTVTANYEHYGLCTPYIIKFHAGKDGGLNRSSSIEEPLKTLDTSNRFAVIEPYIIPCNHGKDDSRANSVDDPMKTITGVDAWAIAEPFLVRFQNNQDAQSVNDPLGTITTKDKFGIAQAHIFSDGFTPDDGEIGICFPSLGIVVFIRFRMLQPHELAAAMSFPKGYKFVGTRADVVKQIGNAVPIKLSKACVKAVISNL